MMHPIEEPALHTQPTGTSAAVAPVRTILLNPYLERRKKSAMPALSRHGTRSQLLLLINASTSSARWHYVLPAAWA